MGKKIIVVAIVLVVVVAVMVMNMRRASVLSQASQAQGGLVAVSLDGTPIPPPANAAATSLPENMAVQQAGDMTVSITLNPYPPTGFNPADFEVTLTGANGQVINDATIGLNLTMPTMWMPPNQFPLISASNGKYSATGQFTMRGPWRIEVVITRSGKTQSVFFDVWL